MWQDPLVEELHRVREQLAAEHDHDLQKIVAHLMERQTQALVNPPLPAKTATANPAAKK